MQYTTNAVRYACSSDSVEIAAHIGLWADPSQTQEPSRSPLVDASEVLHDLSPRRTVLRRRFFWSSRNTEFSSSSCFCKLSGTVCKPCLIAFPELSSCLCMDESTPHLSLRAPHWCAKRLRPVSHVFNVASTPKPRGCPYCRELLARAAFFESLKALLPPQLPVLAEGGLGASALPISSSTGATTACGGGSFVSFLDREAKSLAFHLAQARVALPCRFQDQPMSSGLRT